jgi:hypothetical protein
MTLIADWLPAFPPAPTCAQHAETVSELIPLAIAAATAVQRKGQQDPRAVVRGSVMLRHMRLRHSMVRLRVDFRGRTNMRVRVKFRAREGPAPGPGSGQGPGSVFQIVGNRYVWVEALARQHGEEEGDNDVLLQQVLV